MDFIIKKLMDDNGDIYTKIDNFPTYRSHESSLRKGFYDFIGEDCKILSVVRKHDNVEFSLNDRLQTSSIRRTILNFKISNNNIIIKCTNNISILLNDAVKHIEPVIQPSITNIQTFDTELLNIDRIIHIDINNSIRLEKTAKRRSETPKEFLIKFFTEWNIDGQDKNDNTEAKNTIFVENQYIQTIAGKRRSLGDLYMILKYYYPTITLKEVLRLLYIDLHEYFHINDNGGFRTSKCSQINKRVWYYDPEDCNEICNKTAKDEYGHNWAYYISNLNNSQ